MPRAINLQHTQLSRTDGRLAALIGDHGPTGYGIYWMVIEMLNSDDFGGMPCDEKMIKRMSAQVGIGIFRFRQLLAQMIDLYDLLELQDEYLVSRMAHRRASRLKEPMAAAKSPVEKKKLPTYPAIKKTATKGAGYELCYKDGGTEPEVEIPLVAPADSYRNNDSEEPLPRPRRQYSMEQLRYYEEIKTYIAGSSPALAAMAEPLELEEALDIQACYDQDFIFAVLKDMQNSPELFLHINTYQAFNIYALMREIKPEASPPEPMPAETSPPDDG